MSKRASKLGSGASSSARNESVKILSQEFRLALFSYDEGMISDDKVLAGALWRTFFQQKVVPPQHLEKLVHYVRKQQLHLHKQDEASILSMGLVSFLPLEGEEENVNHTEQIFNNIYKRTE